MSDFNSKKFEELSPVNRLKKLAYHLRDNILERKQTPEDHYIYMINWLNVYEYQNIVIPKNKQEMQELYTFLMNRIFNEDPYQEKTLFDSIGEKRTIFPITLVLENIRSPFNVGSLFRTAESLGVEDIVLVGITPNPMENIKIAKTAKDAIIDFYAVEKVSEINFKANNITFGIEKTNHSLDIKTLTPQNFDPGTHYTLVLGNEEFGISKETLDLCDAVYHIPLLGTKNSLNVSVAGGIFLHYFSNLFAGSI